MPAVLPNGGHILSGVYLTSMHKKLTKTPNLVITIMMVVLAIAIGYAAMWLLGYYASTDIAVNAVLIQVTLIGFALGIAYVILKAVFHAMRLKDPHERELRLKDLPKDAPETRVRQG